MNKKNVFILLLGAILMLGASGPGCNGEPAISTSGLKKATIKVPTNAEGLSIEQQNIVDRLKADNQPGSIKHLYVISAYSGQVIIYSTVRGKATSGGKRLNPASVAFNKSNNDGFAVEFPGGTYYTQEVLGDDGTYGHSSEYLYWWDTKGMYHQHYVSGGQIVHVSSEPLSVKSVIINMETSSNDGAAPEGSGSIPAAIPPP